MDPRYKVVRIRYPLTYHEMKYFVLAARKAVDEIIKSLVLSSICFILYDSHTNMRVVYDLKSNILLLIFRAKIHCPPKQYLAATPMANRELYI